MESRTVIAVAKQADYLVARRQAVGKARLYSPAPAYNMAQPVLKISLDIEILCRAIITMETPNPVDPDPIPHEIPVFPPNTPQPEPIDDPTPDVPAISISFR